VFRSAAFLALEEKLLIRLISDTKLPLNEVVVFQSVLEWGKARCKSDESKRTDELRDVLKNAINHVRFPLLSASELGAYVIPSGVLDEKVMIRLFKYAHGSTEERLALDFPFPKGERAPDFNIPSRILKTCDKKVLRMFFSEDRKKTPSPIKFTLLFDKQKDGGASTTFHQKVDNKGSTFLVFKSGKNVFGAYVQQPWNTSSSYGSGKAWLWSLVNPANEPMKLIGSSNVTYNNSGYGPTFGAGHDLYCPNGFSGCSSNPSSYTQVAPGYKGSFSNTTLTGSSSFNIDECEVFKIEIKNKTKYD